MDEIVVIGGGGHAKVVIGVLRRAGRFRILGYFDRIDNGPILGTEYMGDDDRLASVVKMRNNVSALIAVGQVGLGKQRQEIFCRLSPLGLLFPSVVSLNAVVNEEVCLGAGVVVMDAAVVNCGTVIGNGAIINSNSTVEHDVHIGDWVHVAPGATISGRVTVGQCSMIGAGAVIIEGKNIVADCIVGAGTIVLDDIVEPGTYVGCPARQIR